MKLKTFLINSLGIISTILMVGVIYIILWLEGSITRPDRSVLIEFGITTALAIYCKVFWYKSTENKVRTSDEYIAAKNDLSNAITEAIPNARDFDKFIDNENTTVNDIFNKIITQTTKRIY